MGLQATDWGHAHLERHIPKLVQLLHRASLLLAYKHDRHRLSRICQYFSTTGRLVEVFLAQRGEEGLAKVHQVLLEEAAPSRSARKVPSLAPIRSLDRPIVLSAPIIVPLNPCKPSVCDQTPSNPAHAPMYTASAVLDAATGPT
jgi:hypothetical protein